MNTLRGPARVELEDRARKAFVASEGPACAAWLIRRFKHSIHTGGGFEVVVASTTPRPMWFVAAVGFLRQSKKWAVTEVPAPNGYTVVRVFWKKKLRRLN